MSRPIRLARLGCLRQTEEVVYRVGYQGDVSGEHQQKRKSGADDQRKQEHPKAYRWPRRSGLGERTRIAEFAGHGHTGEFMKGLVGIEGPFDYKPRRLDRANCLHGFHRNLRSLSHEKVANLGVRFRHYCPSPISIVQFDPSL